jgi:hypothetical protein
MNDRLMPGPPLVFSEFRHLVNSEGRKCLVYGAYSHSLVWHAKDRKSLPGVDFKKQFRAKFPDKTECGEI